MNQKIVGSNPTPGAITMDEKVIIMEILPLGEARKDIQYGTEEPYDANDPEQVSEWAVAFAMSHFRVGDEVFLSEINEKIQMGQLQQTLDDMVEDGIIECYFDEEENDLVYRAKQ